ncbi:hypothetical protein FRC18_003800 [Serendipita sp. 400]|nr:hypothetical protein FRC18_003800 [Serendipita sp. 400]
MLRPAILYLIERWPSTSAAHHVDQRIKVVPSRIYQVTLPRSFRSTLFTASSYLSFPFTPSFHITASHPHPPAQYRPTHNIKPQILPLFKTSAVVFRPPPTPASRSDPADSLTHVEMAHGCRRQRQRRREEDEKYEKYDV